MKKETRTQLTNLEKAFKMNYGELTEIGVSIDYKGESYIFNIFEQAGFNYMTIELPVSYNKRPIDYFRKIEECIKNKDYKYHVANDNEKLIRNLINKYECKNIRIVFDTVSCGEFEFELNYINSINKMNNSILIISTDDFEYEIDFANDTIKATELNGWDINGLKEKLHYINEQNENKYNSPIRYYIVGNQLLELDYDDGTFVVMIDDLDNIKCFDGTLNKNELVIEFYNSDDDEMCYFIECNNLCCC